MAKKSYAPPVTNFSVSCDPVTLEWLTEYAYRKKTTRSKVIRLALVDFREKFETRIASENTPKIAPEGCIVCGSEVLRVPGVRGLCLESPAHVQEPPKKVEGVVLDTRDVVLENPNE